MPLLKIPRQTSSSKKPDVLDSIMKSLQNMDISEGIPEKKSEDGSFVDLQKGMSNILIPQCLEMKILLLLKCYPDGLELEKFTYAYSKRFGEHLIPAQHGFGDVIDLLNAMSDKISRVTGSHGRQLLTAKERDKDIRGGISQKKSKQADVSETESSAAHKYLKKSSEELKIERSDCYLDEDCTIPRVPQEVIQTFRSILNEHKGGIILNNLIPEYEMKTHKQFFLQDFGFSSVYDFVSRMKDVFKICKKDSHYVLYNPDSVQISAISCDPKEDGQGCIMRFLSVATQEKLMKLLQEEYPNGLSIEEIIPAYRGLYGATLDDLNPIQYGYRSLIGLFQAHSDLVVLQYCNDTIMVQSSQVHLKNETIRPTTLPSEAVSFGSKYKGLDRNALLPIGKFVEVVVADVYSPMKFWVIHRGINTSQELDSLMDKMFEFYSGKIGDRYLVPSNLITIGAPVAALYTDDENYYRGLITAIEDLTTVRLFLVDYGTMYRCDISYLRLLHRQYFQLPAQAFRASLDDIEPADGRRLWPKVASNIFLNLVQNKGLVAFIKQIKDSQGTVYMDLYDTGDPDDINIASVLIEGGWARKVSNNLEDGITEIGSRPLSETHVHNEKQNKVGGLSTVNESTISANDSLSFFQNYSSGDFPVRNHAGDKFQEFNCTNNYQDHNEHALAEVSVKLEPTAYEFYNQSFDMSVKHTSGPPAGIVPEGSVNNYVVTEAYPVSFHNMKPQYLPLISPHGNYSLNNPMNSAGNPVQQNKQDFVGPSPFMCGQEITEAFGNTPLSGFGRQFTVNNAAPTSVGYQVNGNIIPNLPSRTVPPPPGFEDFTGNSQVRSSSAFATKVTQAVDYPKMSPCQDGLHQNTLNSQVEERDEGVASHRVERLSINATCVFHILFLYGEPYILCDDIVKLLVSCGITEVAPLLKELKLPTVSISKITDKNLYLQLLELGCHAILAEDHDHFDIQPHISAYSLTDVSHILSILSPHNNLIHNASEMLKKHYGKDKECLSGLITEEKTPAGNLSNMKVGVAERTEMPLESGASNVSVPCSRFLHCNEMNICSIKNAPPLVTSTIHSGCDQLSVTKGASVNNTFAPIVFANNPSEISPVAVSLCSTPVSSSAFENFVTYPTSLQLPVTKFENTLSSQVKGSQGVGSLHDPGILTYSNLDLQGFAGMSNRAIFSNQNHGSNEQVLKNSPTYVHPAAPLFASSVVNKFATDPQFKVLNTNYVDFSSDPAAATLVNMDPNILLRPSVMPGYYSEFSAASHMPVCYTSEGRKNHSPYSALLGENKMIYPETILFGASETQTRTVPEPCLLDSAKSVGSVPSSDRPGVSISVQTAPGQALHTSTDPNNSKFASAPRNPRMLLRDVSAKGLRRPADLDSMIDKKSDVSSLQTVPVYSKGNYSANL